MAIPQHRGRGLWFTMIVVIGILITILYLLPRSLAARTPGQKPALGSEQQVGSDLKEAALEPSPVARVAEDPSLVEVVRQLRRMGIQLSQDGRVSEGFAKVPGQRYKIGHQEGEWLSLYPYDSADALEEDARNIPPDAQIGIMDWAAPPHFFRCGRVMVLYLGRENSVTESLTELCGKPFAVGSTRWGVSPAD